MTEFIHPELIFNYLGHELIFYPVSDIDPVSHYLRTKKTFYELDVLEKIRERTQTRDGSAIDVGAFMGTHSVYFHKFCGCHPVYAFEANPSTYPFLLKNIHENGLDKKIVPFPKAIGSSKGHASISYSNERNRGNTVLTFGQDGQADIEVSTIDNVIHDTGYPPPPKLIKIDVEGAEIEVLLGALETIRTYKPLLCIEIHKTNQLLKILAILRGNGYQILDCLGFSPTYIIEASNTPALRRFLSNAIWVIRSLFPIQRFSNIRWYLTRMAQITGGQ